MTREDDTLADLPPCLTTTLYDLIAALQTVVAPHEDNLVVALVTRWLQTGRITSLGKAAARWQGDPDTRLMGFAPTPFSHNPNIDSKNVTDGVRCLQYLL